MSETKSDWFVYPLVAFFAAGAVAFLSSAWRDGIASAHPRGPTATECRAACYPHVVAHASTTECVCHDVAVHDREEGRPAENAARFEADCVELCGVPGMRGDPGRMLFAYPDTSTCICLHPENAFPTSMYVNWERVR